ncbi:MAG: DUF1553 domain-containing protein [Planctomycetaceae bacterium]|nr:DUF1553 domain-containing protein [Planctomycetaceae bacterium]
MMVRVRRLGLLPLAIVAVLCSSPSLRLRGAEPDEAPPDFERQVAPLLARRCLDCHNALDLKGGLDLASRQAAVAGGESGPALDADSPAASYLWERVAADEMPPKHPLSAAEKDLLRRWLTAGAQWSAGEIDRFRITTDARAGYDWWSLQPVVRPSVPSGGDDSWSRTPVDRFIQQGLVERGLAPSPEADRRTLIRRLSYDLLGLPPSRAEIDAFVSDPAPDAFERLVDRLLASPHYGVRWARHWLDVVRFGESNGFEYDEFRAEAWPYRDWVVNALNDDLPYDEFVRRQLAGDVLAPGDLDGAIAAGFLAAGPFDTAGQSQQSKAMRAVVRQDELEDLVGTVGQTFLGLTVNCARCHDHKFDPIRQREYYELSAALAGVRQGKRETAGLQASGRRAELLAQLQNERAATASAIEALERPVREKLLGQPSPPAGSLRPLASWDFTTAADAGGAAPPLQLHGGAARTADGLRLNGSSAYATTGPLESNLAEKSLEVWVRLDNLEQRGGAAIAVQTLDGARFDAVVFAERDAQQWLAGSDNFSRTQSFAGPIESEAHQRSIHFCIAYSADGTITGYRDGKPYGAPYRSPGLASFEAGKWQLLFGLRHSPAAPGKLLAGTIERAQLYDRALTADEVAASSGRRVTLAAIRAELSPDDRARDEALHAELQRCDAALAAAHPPRVYTLTPRDAEATHLLARGNPAQPSDEVPAGGIAALVGVDARFGLPLDAPEAERRRRLAEWITSPQNPLFARVIVNRLWHYHFGVGLVDTPNDFGFNGGRPANQPLLDWLADEFVQQGFRLKSLHRLLVTSAAYRQSSRLHPQAAQLDADNRLLWRKSPTRLEAEAVRDSLLEVAGVLDPRLGGPGFQEMKIAIAPGTGTFLYAPDDPTRAEFKRRTLYRVWARSGRSALLDVFDCPDPSTTSPKRAVTTTPLQALALLNNAFVLHLADEFAARVAQEAGADLQQQIATAYQLALARSPDDAELQAATAAVREHGLVVLARALFNSNEFVYVD